MSIEAVESASPNIEGLLSEVSAQVGASAAVSLQFRKHGERIVISKTSLVGKPENWQRLQDDVGPEGFDPDCSDESLSMREGQWSLQAPARRHFNRFCWLEEDIAQVAPWQRTLACTNLYEANGFGEQYRAILVDHGEVVGWVSFLFDSMPRQRDRVENRVSEKLNEFREIACEAHRIPAASHRVLVNGENDLVAINPDARDVFDPDTLRKIRVQLGRFDESNSNSWYLDGYGVTPVAMRGENGEATLLLIDPLEAVEIDMRRALTSLQERVATLVADGNSNREVAEILGVSTNTVKYHLKRIYPIVGVTNRVELATFLTA